MSRRAALREGSGGGDSAPAKDVPSGDDEVPPSEEEVVTFG